MKHDTGSIDGRIPLWAYAALAIAALLCGAPAAAYVGPGAGLSLLSALWGLIVAIGVALGFVVLWPVRRLRRRRQVAAANGATEETADAAPADEAPANEACVDETPTAARGADARPPRERQRWS